MMFAATKSISISCLRKKTNVPTPQLYAAAKRLTCVASVTVGFSGRSKAIFRFLVAQKFGRVQEFLCSPQFSRFKKAKDVSNLRKALSAMKALATQATKRQQNKELTDLPSIESILIWICRIKGIPRARSQSDKMSSCPEISLALHAFWNPISFKRHGL